MKKLIISSKIRNYEVEFISSIYDHLKNESEESVFIIDKFINSKIKLKKNFNIFNRRSKKLF
jgi:hypothetical protein